jgi:hypothetical protein
MRARGEAEGYAESCVRLARTTSKVAHKYPLLGHQCDHCLEGMKKGFMHVKDGTYAYRPQFSVIIICVQPPHHAHVDLRPFKT